MNGGANELQPEGGVKQVAASGSFKPEQWHWRSLGKINTACELSYHVDAVLKQSALVFYAQRLPSSSFGDIARLVTTLSTFSSNCCLHGAGAECFQDKNSLFLDRVCEDVALKEKKQNVSLCCESTDQERQACFENLRQIPSAHLPALYSSESHQQRCLDYMTDPQDFVEVLLYDLSRRMRMFPTQTIAKIARASLKTYSACCGETSVNTCITTMEKQTVQVITNIIEEANKICNEYKETGEWKTRLWAIIIFASLHPKSVIGTALEFAETYEKTAAKCCEISEWTSDCFLEESELLLNLFCSRSITVAHGDCCLKSGPDRAKCLNQIAMQESTDIPEKIPLRTEKLCEIYKVHNARLLIWYAFEFAIRHRQENLSSVLTAVSNVKLVLKRCCAETFSDACLSFFLPKLSLVILPTDPLKSD
ncbi:hypothetical protein NDU88_001403 [Pleurodeles waltl]|uniref:Albumin domain-containing protein n=1 Tax=Pleurodeles waltl TaxID=8319 RepID=A0AAV7VWA9_PLEWA|nr:hypothetical protein NDU88_001403 [Pleurodeles waltl]